MGATVALPWCRAARSRSGLYLKNTGITRSETSPGVPCPKQTLPPNKPRADIEGQSRRVCCGVAGRKQIAGMKREEGEEKGEVRDGEGEGAGC